MDAGVVCNDSTTYTKSLSLNISVKSLTERSGNIIFQKQPHTAIEEEWTGLPMDPIVSLVGSIFQRYRAVTAV